MASLPDCSRARSAVLVITPFGEMIVVVEDSNVQLVEGQKAVSG